MQVGVSTGCHTCGKMSLNGSTIHSLGTAFGFSSALSGTSSGEFYTGCTEQLRFRTHWGFPINGLAMGSLKCHTALISPKNMRSWGPLDHTQEGSHLRKHETSQVLGLFLSRPRWKKCVHYSTADSDRHISSCLVEMPVFVVHSRKCFPCNVSQQAFRGWSDQLSNFCPSILAPYPSYVGWSISPAYTFKSRVPENPMIDHHFFHEACPVLSMSRCHGKTISQPLWGGLKDRVSQKLSVSPNKTWPFSSRLGFFEGFPWLRTTHKKNAPYTSPLRGPRIAAKRWLWAGTDRCSVSKLSAMLSDQSSRWWSYITTGLLRSIVTWCNMWNQIIMKGIPIYQPPLFNEMGRKKLGFHWWLIWLSMGPMGYGQVRAVTKTMFLRWHKSPLECFATG